jgi:hypothetical protein
LAVVLLPPRHLNVQELTIILRADAKDNVEKGIGGLLDSQVGALTAEVSFYPLWNEY